MNAFLGKREKNIENNIYVLLILVAIELFMSFSFLGYIHVEPISLTFVYIPVLMAGCLLGPKEAALVGAVFGLASMWKASAFYVGSGDAVFSPVMSGKPLGSFLLSVGTRTLFGLIAGLLFRRAKNCRHPLPWILLVASIGRIIHTGLVYGCMQIFFPEAGFGIANTWNDICRWDFIPFTVIIDIIIFLCYRFQKSAFFQKIFLHVDTIDRINARVMPKRFGRAIALILVLFSSFSVAIYFTNRIETVMIQYEIQISDKIAHDLMHLQIQFLLGIISLAFLVMIVIVLYQKNFNYLYFEAKLDGLTGLMGRQQFFNVGEALLESGDLDACLSDKSNCFIILDVDSFKTINDTFGHPIGDMILKRVAENFSESFGDHSIFGRLGGDEFVGLILEPMTKQEIEQALNGMKERLKRPVIEDLTVTCSIGVIPVEKGYSLQEMYRNADRLLYEAKKNGKDQFVFGYRYRDSEGTALP
mgnify:FL=1